MKRIVECIFKIAEISKEIDYDTNLSVYGLDSLKRVELVIELEDKFGISFNNVDMTQKNFETVNNIKELLEKRYKIDKWDKCGKE